MWIRPGTPPLAGLQIEDAWWRTNPRPPSCKSPPKNQNHTPKTQNRRHLGTDSIFSPSHCLTRGRGPETGCVRSRRGRSIPLFEQVAQWLGTVVSGAWVPHLNPADYPPPPSCIHLPPPCGVLWGRQAHRSHIGVRCPAHKSKNQHFMERVAMPVRCFEGAGPQSIDGRGNIPRPPNGVHPDSPSPDPVRPQISRTPTPVPWVTGSAHLEEREGGGGGKRSRAALRDWSCVMDCTGAEWGGGWTTAEPIKISAV